MTGLNQTLDQVPERQHDAWASYLNRLPQQVRRDPSRITRWSWPGIRESVQKTVPVSDTWRPGDQEEFYSSVKRKIESDAWSGFNKSIETQLGNGVRLPRGLSLNDFTAQPAVQAEWRRMLKIECGPGTLSLSESVTEFADLCYQPTFEHLARKRLAEYEAEDSTFVDGGANAVNGEQAMRALLVAPLALAFSLAGGIFHAGKLIGCLLGFLVTSRTLKRLLVAASLATLVIYAWHQPNAVTKSRVFGYFQHRVDEHLGWAPERVLTWVVQAQPLAYPIAESIRAHLPGNVTFGYEPEPRTDRKDLPASEIHVATQGE